MKPKAYKRMTVEFFHEVDGKPQADEIDLIQLMGQGIAHGPGVLETRIVELLLQLGMVKPRVAGIYQRLKEPPLIEL
jgi:hypothetical protein